MSIPNLESNGWLPPGIHETSMEEIRDIFGQTQGSDCRPNLCQCLCQYVEDAKGFEFIKYLIINGSFISSKEKPGDIDVLVVISKDFDITVDEMDPLEYTLTHSKRVKKRYGFIDVFQAQEESDEYEHMISYWARNRNGEAKGLLKVLL